MKAPRPVFFDSSFLMALAEHPTDWSEEMSEELGKYVPVLLECVEKEMLGLAARSGKKGKLARVALQMSSGFERRGSGMAATDDELVSAAASTGGTVATVDKELVVSLRTAHVSVITLRGGRVGF